MALPNLLSRRSLRPSDKWSSRRCVESEGHSTVVMVCSSCSLQTVTCEVKSPFSQKAWSRVHVASQLNVATIDTLDISDFSLVSVGLPSISCCQEGAYAGRFHRTGEYRWSMCPPCSGCGPLADRRRP